MTTRSEQWHSNSHGADMQDHRITALLSYTESVDRHFVFTRPICVAHLPKSGLSAETSAEFAEPADGLVEHLVALAEREPDEGASPVGVEVERRAGHGHHPDLVRHRPAEVGAVVEA